MTIALRVLALVSLLASVLCLGLSGMASDDSSRAARAHGVQLLQLAWLVASIVTPIIAAIVARRDVAASHRAYVPMIVIGVVAIVALARF